MRKILLFCVIILLGTFVSFVRAEEGARRALFVTVIQDPVTLENRQEIMKLVQTAKEDQMQILFVQVYRANMAWFQTKTADTTPYERALKAVGEDPLALLITEAHKEGIEVHAWLNLFTLSRNKDAKILAKYGTSILTRNTEPKKLLKDFEIDRQYFLEPGDPRVREELGRMVMDLVSAYPDLDGVQFDYIRYPDRHPAYGYTPMNLDRFFKSKGIKTPSEQTSEWRQWKRDQVTESLVFLTQKARSVRPLLTVSATGCMPYARAYDEAFQDWPTWVNTGVVDFVTAMNYSTDTREYERWIVGVKPLVTNFRKVYIAFGAYKPETSLSIFSDQLKVCEETGAGGCAIFHYGNLADGRLLRTSLSAEKKAP